MTYIKVRKNINCTLNCTYSGQNRLFLSASCFGCFDCNSKGCLSDTSLLILLAFSWGQMQGCSTIVIAHIHINVSQPISGIKHVKFSEFFSKYIKHTLWTWIFSCTLCNVRPELWLQRIHLSQSNLFVKFCQKKEFSP